MPEATIILALIAFLALCSFIVMFGCMCRLDEIYYELNSIRTTQEIALFEDDRDDVRFAQRLEAWRRYPTKDAGDHDDWGCVE